MYDRKKIRSAQNVTDVYFFVVIDEKDKDARPVQTVNSRGYGDIHSAGGPTTQI